MGYRNYDRQIKLPYPASHELLKREDRLYDIIVVLNHNQRPRIQGLGSAVFFHLARESNAPTAGCLAVSLRDMRIILEKCGTGAVIDTSGKAAGVAKCPIEWYIGISVVAHDHQFSRRSAP